MEAERVDVVRQMIDAWNRRDIDLAESLVGEDFEYVNPPNAVEPGIRRGRDGMKHVMTAQWEALGEGARQDLERFHHRGDVVVTEGTVSRSMPGSDARVSNRIALGWTFEGTRLIRIEVVGAGSSYHEGLANAGIAGDQ